VRPIKQSVVKTFTEFVTPVIWKTLISLVDRNLAIGQTTPPFDRRRRPTSVVELQHFYGIQLAMENTYGNATKDSRRHFAELKTKFQDSWPMGWDRYSALLSAFAPSPTELQELADFLHNTFYHHVHSDTVFVLYLFL